MGIELGEDKLTRPLTTQGITEDQQLSSSPKDLGVRTNSYLPLPPPSPGGSHPTSSIIYHYMVLVLALL
jgi:hypothetical protein